MSRTPWQSRLQSAVHALIGGRSVVGVDVGSAVIKVAEVEQRGGALRMTRIASAPTPGSGIGLDTIAAPEQVADVVRRLVEDIGVRSRSAAVALPLAATRIQRVQIAARGRRELERAVVDAIDRWELDSEQEWSIDWSPLTVDGRHARDCSVLLVAAPTHLVRDYADCLREADLVPVAVDVDAIVLDQLVAHATVRPESVLAIVDVGARHACVNILRNGVTAFHGSLDPGMGGGAGPEEATGPAGDVGAGEAPWVGAFVEDLHHMLAYYWWSAGEDGIDEVWLSGGGANAEGLAARVEARLGARTEVLDPGSVFGEGDRGVPPEYAVATALALRARAGR